MLKHFSIPTVKLVKAVLDYSIINISALFHKLAIFVQDSESTIQLTVCVRG